MNIYNYQAKKYNFTSLIENLFECDDLSKLHEKIPEDKKYNELFKVGYDSSTIFHEIFYKKLNSTWVEFSDMYYDFIKLTKNIAFPNTDEVLYQKFPTFRVHLPDNLAVGDFHSDSEYNHPKGEINFVVPLTYMFGTNTIWCESQVGMGDFHPIPRIGVGDLFSFNGNQIRHGNLVNKTGSTRVSFDFRMISIESYNKNNNSNLKSVTTKTKFCVGSYYEKYKK